MIPPEPAFESQTGGSARPADPFDPGPIGRVEEGMTVVDAAGEEIGTVSRLRMGDPGAVTTEGQETLDDSLRVFRGAGDPNLPEPLRDQLLIAGYIAIDRKGVFSGTAYARADQIASVSDGAVRLLVAVDALPAS